MGTGGCQAIRDAPLSAVVLLGHQLFGVVEPVVVVDDVVCCSVLRKVQAASADQGTGVPLYDASQTSPCEAVHV